MNVITFLTYFSLYEREKNGCFVFADSTLIFNKKIQTRTTDKNSTEILIPITREIMITKENINKSNSTNVNTYSRAYLREVTEAITSDITCYYIIAKLQKY